MSLSFKLTYNTNGFFFFKQKTPTTVNYLYKTSNKETLSKQSGPYYNEKLVSVEWNSKHIYIYIYNYLHLICPMLGTGKRNGQYYWANWLLIWRTINTYLTSYAVINFRQVKDILNHKKQRKWMWKEWLFSIIEAILKRTNDKAGVIHHIYILFLLLDNEIEKLKGKESQLIGKK